MDKELCPFCGAGRNSLEIITEAKEIDIPPLGYPMKVHCGECDSYGPSAVVDNPEFGDRDAINLWNKRI